MGAASLSKRTKTPTHLKLFRRAEKPDELIVERSVKQAIEKAKTPQITFDACDA